MKERLCEYCNEPVDTGGLMHPQCYKFGDDDYLDQLEESWRKHEDYIPRCFKERSNGGRIPVNSNGKVVKVSELKQDY